MTGATEHDALALAARTIGVEPSELMPLHRHATTVYVTIPSPHIVVRLTDSAPGSAHAHTAVAVTRWLIEQGFPATEPADVDQPLNVGPYTVTFWRYYPQNDRAAPGAGHLGALLRELHQLPEPPIKLPAYQPLAELGATLDDAHAAALAADDRRWLQHRRDVLLNAYRDLDSPLGAGFIHGDAYPGNTLWDDQRVRLGDWDEAAHGPRVIDLVNTHQGRRVGRSDEERAAFTAAYGWDVTSWRGFSVLREMRDLHTLGSFIRRAGHGDDPAARELHHRIRTLRSNDADARWHAARRGITGV